MLNIFRIIQRIRSDYILAINVYILDVNGHKKNVTLTKTYMNLTNMVNVIVNNKVKHVYVFLTLE